MAASVAANKRTVVRSAAGIGKSYLSAVIVCWWVTTHPVNEVYVWTTAPGFDQVSGILWEDIRKLHKRLQLPGRIGRDNRWIIDDVLVAGGRKPADKAKGADDDPDTGQGFHRRYLLVVLDDAGGLQDWLWDAAENITTGHDCRILGTGNPDHAGSRFAQLCTGSPLWTHFKASYFDSPNHTGERIPDDLRHVLTDDEWQEARLAEWGADDRRYLSKVLAEFPSDHPDQVVPAAALAECFMAEPRAASELAPVSLGVDVGGGSDLTVIRERRGVKAGRRWAIRTSDSEAAAQARRPGGHRDGGRLGAGRRERRRLGAVRADPGGTAGGGPRREGALGHGRRRELAAGGVRQPEGRAVVRDRQVRQPAPRVGPVRHGRGRDDEDGAARAAVAAGRQGADLHRGEGRRHRPQRALA